MRAYFLFSLLLMTQTLFSGGVEPTLLPEQVSLNASFDYVVRVELEGNETLWVKTPPDFSGFIFYGEERSERVFDDGKEITITYKLEPIAPGNYALGGGEFYLGDQSYFVPYKEIKVLAEKLQAQKEDFAPLAPLPLNPQLNGGVSPNIKDQGTQLGLEEAVKNKEKALWFRAFLKDLIYYLILISFAVWAVIRFVLPVFKKFSSFFNPELSPKQRALKLIEALKKEREKGALSKNAFYTALIDVLRQFIEEKFFIQAPELSTEEFLVELTQEEAIPEEEKELLKEFLVQADLVKFAKAGVEGRLESEAAEKAVEFVKHH